MFTEEESVPSALNLIQISPVAPICGRFTQLTNSSICFRVYSAAPLTAIPTTNSASSKTPKPNVSPLGVRGLNCIPNLMSGLSFPYKRIASSYNILGNSLISTPFTSFNKWRVKPSKAFNISSCSTNAISQSICVNSGCLSARKSSSLKHFTIWKYLSMPPTINNCLNIWGDWGSA